MAQPIFSVSITGQKAIDRKLKRFVPALRRRIINKSLREGPKAVRPAVARRIRQRKDTGASAKGFKTRVMRPKGGSLAVRLTGPTRETLSKNNPNYDPGNKNNYYPGFQDLGTSKIRPLNAYKKGFEEKVNDAEAKITRKMWSLIRAEMKKR